jgi:hypothetical protein
MLDPAQKTKLLRKNFPKLSDQEIQNLHEFLDDYCELLLQVFDRFAREQQPTFDRESDAS